MSGTFSGLPRSPTKLHEVELHVKDPGASRHSYHDLLGLRLDIDEPGLKVFHTGWEGLDLYASQHYPRRVSLSFLVADLDAYLEKLRAAGVEVGGPHDAHLAMRAVSFADPDGHLPASSYSHRQMHRRSG